MNTTNETNGTVTTTKQTKAAERKEFAQRRKELEQVIDRHLPKYLEHRDAIGEALHEIKTRKLFKHEFKSWEEYCEAKYERSPRTVNRHINKWEVKQIETQFKSTFADSQTVTIEKTAHAPVLRPLGEREIDSMEGLERPEKEAKVQELMQTPAPVPPRTPRMPPPRMVLADTSGPEPGPVATKEPELQKPTCPLDNAQLNWVVHEIERCYIDNKPKWNKIPPPAPMTIVSAIQHQLQKWKL